MVDIYLWDAKHFLDLPTSKYCILSHHSLFASFSKSKRPSLIKAIDLTFQRFAKACYTIASEQSLYRFFSLGLGNCVHKNRFARFLFAILLQLTHQGVKPQGAGGGGVLRKE